MISPARTCMRKSTPTGGPPTTSRSARSTCWTTPADRAPHGHAHQAAPARTLGHHPRPQLRLRPPEPRHHRTRPGHDLHRRAGPRRARRRRARLARGLLQRDLPGRLTGRRRDAPPVPPVHASPAASPATWPRRPPAPSTRAANSATPSRTPTARPSTTPASLVACVIGDGEAETGPLAASWHSNKFPDPDRDGAVLPILHLNGYKIANPTVLSRIPADDLTKLMEGTDTAATPSKATTRRSCTS